MFFFNLIALLNIQCMALNKPKFIVINLNNKLCFDFNYTQYIRFSYQLLIKITLLIKILFLHINFYLIILKYLF